MPGGAGFRRGGSTRFDQLDDQALDNSPDLVQLKSTPAFFIFGIFGFLKMTMEHHRRGGTNQRRSSHQDPPIDCQIPQRFGSRAEAGSNMSPSVSRAFSQSFRNPSRPLSVRGCLKSCSKTLYGMVPMCAPMRAAATTCSGCRRLAASTCVG